METAQKDLQAILKIARAVGWSASEILRSYYHGTAQNFSLNVQYKDQDPITAADVAVSEYILQELKTALGDDDFGYISEETYKQQQGKHPAEWVWIIDPLDGTRDFIEKTGEYGIHIALVKQSRPVLAVVVIPEAEKLYFATANGGTFVETAQTIKPVKISSNKPLEDLILVVSRSHRHEKLEFLLKHLPCQQQKAIGSVGCKIAAIVEQQADVYISLSGKSAPKDWDMAAPELILTEAGGNFTHFDGQSLQYNTGDISQWGGILASNSPQHQLLCQTAAAILLNFVSQASQ